MGMRVTLSLSMNLNLGFVFRVVLLVNCNCSIAKCNSIVLFSLISFLSKNLSQVQLGVLTLEIETVKLYNS